MSRTEWFTSWFNTSYYHILYKDRNDEDAQIFMKNITQFLKLPQETHILDLPCGKGRHSVYLNSLGYQVTGGDLSENSIGYAKQFENARLKFKVKDMRQAFKERYDAVFNLFTSFGYFEADEEDVRVLQNIKNSFIDKGVLVLDFLNVEKVKQNIVKKETKSVEGIDFHIQREIKDGFILKHISFNDHGKNHSYTEHVKYLDLKKFKEYFKCAGMSLENVFGDYKLSEFDPNTSDRLILVAK